MNHYNKAFILIPLFFASCGNKSLELENQNLKAEIQNLKLENKSAKEELSRERENYDKSKESHNKLKERIDNEIQKISSILIKVNQIETLLTNETQIDLFKTKFSELASLAKTTKLSSYYPNAYSSLEKEIEIMNAAINEFNTASDDYESKNRIVNSAYGLSSQIYIAGGDRLQNLQTQQSINRLKSLNVNLYKTAKTKCANTISGSCNQISELYSGFLSIKSLL